MIGRFFDKKNKIKKDSVKLEWPQAALKEGEEVFKNVFEYSPMGIELYDEEGKLTQINQACIDIFGIAYISDVEGFNLFDDPNLMQEEREKIKKGKLVRYEAEFDFEKAKEQQLYRTNKSGSIYLDVIIAPLTFKGKEIGGYIVQTQDITRRKQIEVALMESEKKYRLLAENIIDLIWVTDLHLRFIYVSPSVSRLLGYSVDETMYQPVKKVLTLDSIAFAEDVFSEELLVEQMVQKDLTRSRTLELEHVRKDGSHIWAEVKVTFLRDEKKQPVGIIGVTRDISERKRMEEELTKHRDHLEEMVAKRTLELKMLNAQLEHEVSEHKRAEEELINIRQDLEIRVQRRTTELARTNVELQEEIAEHKDAEARIASLNKQIEFILGATKTGLDIIDADYNIRYIDPEWKKVYGEYAGKKCYEYFMDSRQVCPDCGLRKAFQTKQVTVTEEILAKEGNRPVQVTTIPYQDENGNWLAAEVNVDISERKKAEEKLRQAQQELIQSEKLAALGKFSSAVAHEIKNPLGIILGGIEFLERELNTANSEVKTALEKIKESILRADSVAMSILQFARPPERSLERLKLEELIENVISLLKYRSALANIKIDRLYSPQEIFIEVNRNQILQVIFNVMVNAIEAMPHGGKIIVKTEKKDSMPGHALVKHSCLIEITDTGVGFSKESLERIFEPFVTTKKEIRGTGLGLYASKLIIDSHKGAISVESEVGKGTTVRIFLPLAEQGG
jgi:PAS domain S-box-containing protein